MLRRLPAGNPHEKHPNAPQHAGKISDLFLLKHGEPRKYRL
jgi:hypothetical protein